MYISRRGGVQIQYAARSFCGVWYTTRDPRSISRQGQRLSLTEDPELSPCIHRNVSFRIVATSNVYGFSGLVASHNHARTWEGLEAQQFRSR